MLGLYYGETVWIFLFDLRRNEPRGGFLVPFIIDGYDEIEDEIRIFIAFRHSKIV